MDTLTIVVMVDGLDPEYLAACHAPNLDEIARRGFRTQARGMIPTVTNVNNVSLLTGSYPEVHGITSNYLLDREQDTEIYMESGEYIQTQSVFQRAAAQGRRSLLVTAKDKLRRLLSDGATVSVSSEQPLDWVAGAVGEPPNIYSLEVNRWVLDAGRYIMSQQEFDVVYLTTTDYAMHTYAPEHPESDRHISLLDEAIGELMALRPEARILVTADHGMSSKTRMLHLPEALSRYGIKARAVPIIKDRYTVHHSNLGGSIYVHLDRSADLAQSLDVLGNLDGVDEAIPREEAARRFHLMEERIGDLMIMGAEDVVFGDPAEVDLPPNLRSHGSSYEADVPIIACGPGLEADRFRQNLDVGRYVLDEVLG